MALSSSMIQLGSAAHIFNLPDVTTEQSVSLREVTGRNGVLVMFICAHCPYVVHIREELARLGRDYKDSGIGIVAISSNDPVTYPSDAPEKLKEMVAEAGFTFPLLFDETQDVARAYDAVCTPDFFLYDMDFRLVYRGQLDDTRPGKGAANGQDLRAAMDALLGGKAISTEQRPSTGCGIKWKQG